MSDHIVILGLAVAGLAAFLIYKGVAAAREKEEEKHRGRRALGFESLPSPPAEVAEPILALHRQGKAEQKLDAVFERRGSTDRLYLFDLKNQSGEGGHRGVIAVFSPRLRLPRLTVFPRLDGDGRLAALGNFVLKRLAQRNGPAVDFTSHPRFARRHFVSGPDEAAIRRLLTEDRLDRLAEMGHMAVAGEGELLTYQRVQIGRRRRRADRTEVSESVQRAEELLRVLGS